MKIMTELNWTLCHLQYLHNYLSHINKLEYYTLVGGHGIVIGPGREPLFQIILKYMIMYIANINALDKVGDIIFVAFGNQIILFLLFFRFLAAWSPTLSSLYSFGALKVVTAARMYQCLIIQLESINHRETILFISIYLGDKQRMLLELSMVLDL